MAERASEVDADITALPEPAGARLKAIRVALHVGVPCGHQAVRYGMPAVMLGARYAIHVAGWKAHAGLYPVPDLGGELEAEVTPLRRSTNTVALRSRDPPAHRPRDPHRRARRGAADLLTRPQRRTGGVSMPKSRRRNERAAR